MKLFIKTKSGGKLINKVMISLKNKDCIKFLEELPSESVDHINADPPYNIGYDGGDDWDRFPTEEEYLNWCGEWIAECERVLKPNRMLCIWGTQKTDTFFRIKLDILNHTSLTDQNAIHWSYNWGGRPRNNFAHKFETAWCYSKGKDFYFDRTKVEVPRKMKMNIRTGKEYDNGTIPTTIWEGNLATTSKEAKGSNFHPTVKPQFILQRMINAYTKEGETVLDPFSGSGSTMIASCETNRNFIGSEISTDYYNQSIKRLQLLYPLHFQELITD
jgi:adenine-specific DNA-methyltransferase